MDEDDFRPSGAPFLQHNDDSPVRKHRAKGKRADSDDDLAKASGTDFIDECTCKDCVLACFCCLTCCCVCFERDPTSCCGYVWRCAPSRVCPSSSDSEHTQTRSFKDKLAEVFTMENVCFAVIELVMLLVYFVLLFPWGICLLCMGQAVETWKFLLGALGALLNTALVVVLTTLFVYERTLQAWHIAMMAMAFSGAALFCYAGLSENGEQTIIRIGKRVFQWDGPREVFVRRMRSDLFSLYHFPMVCIALVVGVSAGFIAQWFMHPRYNLQCDAGIKSDICDQGVCCSVVKITPDVISLIGIVGGNILVFFNLASWLLNHTYSNKSEKGEHTQAERRTSTSKSKQPPASLPMSVSSLSSMSQSAREKQTSERESRSRTATPAPQDANPMPSGSTIVVEP